MLRFRDSLNITVTPGTSVLLAAVLMLLPLKWIAAWMAATLVHELGHYLALRIMRIPVYSITATPRGILMETGVLSGGGELFTALAGPVGALVLLLVARIFPAVAVCACIQSLYNLLPVFPLDGGRALRCLLTKIPAPAAVWVSGIVEWLVLSLAAAAGCYGTFCMKLGILPVVGAICLFLRAECVKIPCKESDLRVQYSKRFQRGM